MPFYNIHFIHVAVFYLCCSQGSVIVDYQLDFSGRGITTEFILVRLQNEFISAVNTSSFGDYDVELLSLEFEGKCVF